MKKIRLFFILAITVVCLFMTSCTPELSGNMYVVVSVDTYAMDAQQNIIYKCKIKTLNPIHTNVNSHLRIYTRELYSVGDTLYIGKYEPES